MNGLPFTSLCNINKSLLLFSAELLHHIARAFKSIVDNLFEPSEEKQRIKVANFICYLHVQNSPEMDFFTEYGDANRYKIQEVIGKGSYGVVCSAIDTHTGEKVAIKKIHDIFEHISDAARILREIKLLRLLRHPDIVEIKHIMLPPSRRDFKDIYVVFELMESDLHQVIKANDDLTKEHYQFFLYQLLRALKYIHTGMFCSHSF